MIEYIRVKLYAECKFSRFSGSGTSPSPTAEYTEEGLHKPYFNSANSWGIWAGSLLYNSGSAKLCPRKGHEFDEIEIPADYNDLNGISNANRVPKLIGLEVRLVPGVSFTIPGWIDSIEPVAVKGPSTNCRIKWHIDYWLMEELYRNYAAHFPALTPRVPFTFGQGRIKRGPASLKRPDPSAPRQWIYDSTGDIILNPFSDDQPTKRDIYCIILHTETVTEGQNTYTTIKTAYFSLFEAPNVWDGVTYKVMDLWDIYGGFMEEYMGLAPSSIIGVWFSPIKPLQSASLKRGPSQFQRFWYEDFAGSNQYVETMTLVNPIKTDDTHKFSLIDPQTTVMATLPWGLEVKSIKYYVDVGTAGCSLMVDLIDSSGNAAFGEGRHIQIPLIMAPVTSNDMSDYVLSGQREYDRNMARLQQEQALASGITGAGQSAIGGSIAGSMGKAGGGVGAIAGLGVSILGSVANYFITGYYDDKTQEQTDRLVSNQISNVIINSGGISWIQQNLGIWRLAKLVRDSVSAAELTAEQSELGYLTDVYAADCSTIISQGGGLRIEGLEVRGDVPRQGRDYISALFARGVHLDIIN